MDPIAFQLGPFTVRWYGLLISSACIIGTYLAYREAKKQDLDPDRILDFILLVVPLAIIGARLYYVIFNWSLYRDEPAEIIAIWHGGLAIHGAIITALLVGYYFTRKYKINFWQLADIFAPSLVLGQAIGRWGNFFNQEAYGTPTDLPWAMYIDGAYRHPTFLYESIWDAAIFIFLIWARRKPFMKRGEVFLTYAALYSFGRFFIEGLRTDSLMLGPLRVAQVVSLLGIAAGIGIMVYRRKKGKVLENKAIA